MEHRGAESADNKTGDGAGLLMQIPDALYRKELPSLPEQVLYGTGIVFLPRDAGEAAAMLSRLRGRSHLVYTGVSVWQPATWRMINELASSVVWMRDYTDAEIEAYVATGDPLDKAGAYAIQHRGFAPVDRIEGCWLTVMGLPLCHLRRALESYGVAVPANVPGSCYAFTHQACEVPLVLPH